MTAALWGAASALSWGAADFIARFTGARMGVCLALFVMMSAGAAALTAGIYLSGHPVVGGGAKAYGLAIAAGVSAMIATGMFYWALVRGPVSVASPLVGVYPVFALLIAAAEGSVPTLAQFAAIAVVMAGCLAVSRHGPAPEHGAGGGNRKTVVAALSAGAIFAVTIWFGQQAAAEMGEAQAAWAGRIASALTAGLVLLVPRQRPGLFGNGPLWPWLLLACAQGLLDTMGFFAVIAAHGPDAEIAVVISSGFTGVTVILARLVLKESMTVRQWLGVGMIIAGAASLTA